VGVGREYGECHGDGEGVIKWRWVLSVFSPYNYFGFLYHRAEWFRFGAVIVSLSFLRYGLRVVGWPKLEGSRDDG